MDAFSEFADLIRAEVGLASNETLRVVLCDPNDQSENPSRSFEIIDLLAGPGDGEPVFDPEEVTEEILEKVVEEVVASEARYLNDSQAAAFIEVSTKLAGASFG